MTDKTTQGLDLLIDALDEAQSIVNQYYLYQHVGYSLDELIDQVNRALNPDVYDEEEVD